ADLQQALNSASWTVDRSDNPAYSVGDTWRFDPVTPELNVVISESRLMLAGPWKHELRSDSVGAERLGWTQLSSAPQQSTLPWAVHAAGTGSVVRLGIPSGPNGKLYIAGKVLAHSAIELHSGAPQSTSTADAVYVELEATGLLETLSGSITLSPVPAPCSTAALLPEVLSPMWWLPPNSRLIFAAA
ncbi:MAG: hypothetical protein ACKOEO_14775, partial [Planctomycetaceae bacterium]